MAASAAATAVGTSSATPNGLATSAAIRPAMGRTLSMWGFVETQYDDGRFVDVGVRDFADLRRFYPLGPPVGGRLQHRHGWGDGQSYHAEPEQLKSGRIPSLGASFEHKLPEAGKRKSCEDLSHKSDRDLGLYSLWFEIV
eukprot:CAMPEP_0195022302 /NCGR_PEP_ID=MMETSP0326_2-20130528/40108_1 /TAXON_ID=2866 ORGANISM="Crypthecodinium cohnii, Strain Seligo" /NCGR_SAMPLE_ID=MMETSP0326_2 /ASSEMBLY_ACC=CAM_ASM_000348 /LENGTH=139 /DNA_ID=CAMNT_0040041991 /DNA_START=13 /DNA_END=430 /DNA_ORIENTATION=+